MKKGGGDEVGNIVMIKSQVKITSEKREREREWGKRKKYSEGVEIIKRQKLK